MLLLLDSSVLIDTLRERRRRPELLAELVRAGHSLATSSLNIAEVYAGMRATEQSRTDFFLSCLDCFEITRATGKLAGTLKNEWARKGRTLTLADTLVAAVALEQGCTLLTDNRKDFPMPELGCYPLDSGK